MKTKRIGFSLHFEINGTCYKSKTVDFRNVNSSTLPIPENQAEFLSIYLFLSQLAGKYY